VYTNVQTHTHNTPKNKKTLPEGKLYSIFFISTRDQRQHSDDKHWINGFTTLIK